MLRQGTGAILSLAPSPDGRTLAFFAITLGEHMAGNRMRFLDLTTGAVDHRETGSEGVAWSLAYSPDGKTIAEARADRRGPALGRGRTSGAGQAGRARG